MAIESKLSTVLQPRWRTLIVPALLCCILLYAALLRLDALFKSYGPYDQPRWLAAMQPSVASAAATITPDWPWRRDPTPYVGGDPINYLKFARAMRNFYAAHVREPMFPAMTRIGLMFTNDQDVGVSVTSIVFGLLALVATYATRSARRNADGRVGSRRRCSASITAPSIGRSAVGATSSLPFSLSHAHGRGCDSAGCRHARMRSSPARSAEAHA